MNCLPEFDLTFQKFLLNVPNENKRKTDRKCCSPCLDDEEDFSLEIA